jgi:hypothetical protein
VVAVGGEGTWWLGAAVGGRRFINPATGRAVQELLQLLSRVSPHFPTARSDWLIFLAAKLKRVFFPIWGVFNCEQKEELSLCFLLCSFFLSVRDHEIARRSEPTSPCSGSGGGSGKDLVRSSLRCAGRPGRPGARICAFACSGDGGNESRWRGKMEKWQEQEEASLYPARTKRKHSTCHSVRASHFPPSISTIPSMFLNSVESDSKTVFIRSTETKKYDSQLVVVIRVLGALVTAEGALPKRASYFAGWLQVLNLGKGVMQRIATFLQQGRSGGNGGVSRERTAGKMKREKWVVEFPSFC